MTPRLARLDRAFDRYLKAAPDHELERLAAALPAEVGAAVEALSDRDLRLLAAGHVEALDPGVRRSLGLVGD